MSNSTGGVDRTHFDGKLLDDERSPDGYLRVRGLTAALVDPEEGTLVLTGNQPGTGHNCDQRGCGSVEHKIAEFDIESDLFERVSEPLESE